MAAIGIDLGSNKAVMGVVKRRGLDIVLNDSSARQTPVQIAYSASERLIGDSVKIQVKRNFKNSVLFPMRFLGLNATCAEQLALEQRFTTHKIVNFENNKIGMEVVQSGNKYVFFIEQILAFYLCKLHEFYVKDGVTTKEVVLSIPSYCSNIERQALLDAADIAGLKCLRVLNENTAIAYNYGFFRKADLDQQNERIVAFVDMGHSKTTVTIAAFKQQSARIIAHGSDRNLGGRDLDWQILQKAAEEFTAKYGDDPRKSPRCVLRMLETIEKARKMLSSDTESTISIDYLLNEEDLVKKLTRDEFQALIDPQVRALSTLLQDVIAKSQLSTDQIHSVELVGDCTRTPIVQDIIKQAFNKQELSRTLNSLECIARGAALNSAMLSPNFNVQDFSMQDYNSLPVTVGYQFKDPETGELKSPMVVPKIFATGQNFPMSKEIKFANKEGDLTLSINYDEEASLMQGLPNTIAQYTIGKGKRRKPDVQGAETLLVIRVGNTVHQTACLESVTLTEKWTEEEKIPVKTSGGSKPAAPPKAEDKKEGEAAAAEGEAAPAEEQKAPEQPEEQKYETRTKKKEATSEVSFKTVSHAIPADQRLQFRNQEDLLMKEDRKILDLKETKYELESYTYDLKNNVAEYGNYEHFVDPSLKGPLLEQLQATEEWLYGDGENADLQTVQDRLEALKAVGNPVKARWRFRNEIGDSISIWQKFEASVQTQLGQIAHLTAEQRQQVVDKCGVMQQYFVEINSLLESKQRHEDLPYTLSDVEQKQVLMESEINAILKSPPPAPKKEEKKEEEKKEESAAAEGESKPAEEKKDGDEDMWEDVPEEPAGGDPTAAQQ